MSGPVVGVVGAGQLARMTVQAAVGLAVDTRVLAPDRSDPACSAATDVVVGDPDDVGAVERFSEGCDVVTFDHERVDPAMLVSLESAGRLVRPSSSVMRFADKAHQRAELAAMGFPVPAFRVVASAGDVEHFASAHGWPVVAKLAVGGYDGRGVFVLDGPIEARRLMHELSGRRVVVEPMLDIDVEVAVVVARRPGGEAVAYPVVETTQDDGICLETVTPSTRSPGLEAEATRLALAIASAVDATGVLAVELFVTAAGLVVNELAPRPHNSGHWTIGGAVTSQFENHLRGVLDWPLGDTARTAPAVAMANVLGRPDGLAPATLLPVATMGPGVRAHLYDKAAVGGRKLGHVTASGPDRDTALARARAMASALGSRTVDATDMGVLL